MIKATFTCDVCGSESEVDYDDIEEKTVVPVCDKCYNKFLKRKNRLQRSIRKLYEEYHIGCPVLDF